MPKIIQPKEASKHFLCHQETNLNVFPENAKGIFTDGPSVVT